MVMAGLDTEAGLAQQQQQRQQQQGSLSASDGTVRTPSIESQLGAIQVTVVGCAPVNTLAWLWLPGLSY